jgi:hypothetical protein
MFLRAHISLRIFGQTVTLTSPRWALRRSIMKVRDCPMPPPMLSGSASRTIAWWYGDFRTCSWFVSSRCLRRVAALTRIPIEVSSWRLRVTGFQTRMSPFSPCIGRPSFDFVSVTQLSQSAARISCG